MDWFHCMRCIVMPEDFESASSMPTFFLTSCGHILCAPCTNNDLSSCTKCGSSPIQMMAISDDMPDDIKGLFTPVGDSIKSIYKGIAFQTAHAEHLFDGITKKEEHLSRKNDQMSQNLSEAYSKINLLTEKLNAMTLKLEAAERLNEKYKQDAMDYGHGSRMMNHGAEISPDKRAAKGNNPFSRMLTSPPVKRRPNAPFEQKRRPVEPSFPEGMSVHPVLTAKTPDELRKALMDPLGLGRPKPACEMPRGAKSPPYVRRLDMDAAESDNSRKRSAYHMPRRAKSPPPAPGRRYEMKQREELRRMAHSPPLSMFHWDDKDPPENRRKKTRPGSRQAQADVEFPPPSLRHDALSPTQLAVDPPAKRVQHQRDQILHDPNAFKLSTQISRKALAVRGNIRETTDHVVLNRIHCSTVMPSLQLVESITRNVVRALLLVTWNHSARDIRLLVSLPMAWQDREIDMKKFYARVTVESIVLQYLHIDESGEKEEYQLTDTPELAFKRQCFIRPGATEVRLLGPLTIEVRLCKNDASEPIKFAYPFKTKHQCWLQPDIRWVGSDSNSSIRSTERADAECVQWEKEHAGTATEKRIDSAALATHPDSSFTTPAESSDDDSEEHGAFWA